VEVHVHEGEVDGVPAFWVDQGPPHFVALMFRVGAVDETFLSRGITHLAEHIALALSEERGLYHNGHVDMDQTVFVLNDQPAEWERPISALCAALGNLTSEDVGHHRRILQAESNNKTFDGAVRALRNRFGNVGPGLMATHEWGLRWLNHDSTQAWANSSFTRANLVLVATAAPAENIHLDLPEGVRRHRPSYPDLITEPTMAVEGSGGVVASFNIERTTANQPILQIIRQELLLALRRGAGQIYDILVDYRPVDAQRAVASLTAICQDVNAAEVAAGMLSALDHLTFAGPALETIRDVVKRFDPARAASSARAHREMTEMASSRLLGEEPTSLDQLWREIQGIQPEDVSHLVAAAREKLLLMVPPVRGIDNVNLPRLVPTDGTILGGRQHSWQGDPSWRGTRLVHNERGVQIYPSDGSPPFSIEYSNLVACIEENSYRRHLISSSGSVVSVWPGDWTEGSELLGSIERAISPELRLRIDEEPLVTRPLPVRLPVDL
jgi:zinc protease